MIMQAYDRVDDAEASLRMLLGSCSAMRRERIFTALHVDTNSMEKALERMVGRGEVEVIRPLYAQARHSCHYRLRREPDVCQQKKPQRLISRSIKHKAYQLPLGFA